MIINVRYRNNLDRVDPKMVDATTATPIAFLNENGISIGTRNLQINGVTLSAEELNTSFASILASHPNLDSGSLLTLSAVAKGDGGCQ